MKSMQALIINLNFGHVGTPVRPAPQSLITISSDNVSPDKTPLPSLLETRIKFRYFSAQNTKSLIKVMSTNGKISNQ